MKMQWCYRSAFLLGAMVLLIAPFSCTSSEKGGEGKESEVAAENLPVFTLQEDATFNFGTVKEGEVVEKTFIFKNEGKFPLVISNISSSCGCTTPEWPREPIQPDQESRILVRFNTKGKPGPQSKTVVISANTEPAVIELRLTGIVEGTSS